MLHVGLQPRLAGRQIVADAPGADGQVRQTGGAQALHLAPADAQRCGEFFGGQHVSSVSIGLATPAAPTFATWV